MSTDFSQSEKNLSTFGQRMLAAFRYAPKGEIANKLGVANSAVTNYLQGRIPDAATLEKISDFTNCSIHWLITGEGSRSIINDRDANLVNVEGLKSLIREVLREEIDLVKVGKPDDSVTMKPADLILAPVVAKIESSKEVSEELPLRKTG